MKEEVRAFTIIELLTVIAIIAILAAILFPVFASAKLAAKGAVTLSNLQQIGTAEQEYLNDYDDTVVLSGRWDDPSGNDLATIQISSVNHTVSTWCWLLNPYIKDGAVMQDPLSPLNGQIVNGGNNTAQQLFFPQFGMNYTYLTPYNPNASSDPNNPGLGYNQIPVELNMIDKPAQTVFGTSKYSYSESLLRANGWPYFPNASSAPDGSPCLWTTVQPPDCLTANSDTYHDCYNANWGADDGFINSSGGVGLSTETSGANSGGVAIRNGGGLASVLFMDTHAKKLSPQELAAGTNWTPTIQANQIVTTNPDVYLWDLN